MLNNKILHLCYIKLDLIELNNNDHKIHIRPILECFVFLDFSRLGGKFKLRKKRTLQYYPPPCPAMSGPKLKLSFFMSYSEMRSLSVSFS